MDPESTAIIFISAARAAAKKLESALMVSEGRACIVVIAKERSDSLSSGRGAISNWAEGGCAAALAAKSGRY